MELLAPPTDGIHVLFDKLLEYLNNHSAKQKYAITIKQSKKIKKQELRKVWLQCDKSGEYKGRRKDIRQISSRHNECPWKTVTTRDTELETWTFQINNLEHNHSPTLSGGHPTHRKKAMTDNTKMTIISQTQVNS